MRLTHNLVLGSQSPRRKQLLQEAGFQFRTLQADMEEKIPDGMPVREAAEYLAREKARVLLSRIGKDELLLTADCLVIQDNVVYGKPDDYAEAHKFLKTLSGSMHQVITGVCLCTHETLESFSDLTNVFMSDLREEEISDYINTFLPFDKAGAYGIQDWIGVSKIYRIEGSYTNVVGLPMARVYEHLRKWELTGDHR